MYNFMVVFSSKSGLPIKAIGELPLPAYEIAGVAHLAMINSMIIENDTCFNYNLFDLYLIKDGMPFAEGRDGTKIRLLLGDKVNAVVSINKEDDLIPAEETFKWYNYGSDKSIELVLEELTQEQMRNYKNKGLFYN